MAFTYIRRAALVLALLATATCTVKSTEPPPLTGPSGLALTLNLNAIPDSISQDGGSQSSVRVTAIGPDGKGISALPLRVDMMVNGVTQDYGTLSARTIVTNGDGLASVVYTAPPSPSNGIFGTCNSLPGNCVSIVATATATNFATANPEQVLIRLVPVGVILPPAGAPTAAFTYSPTAVSAGLPIQFDASTSLPGTGATQISTYSWNFGDGTSGSGQNVTHKFGAGNSFVVTLTVTNDRGLAASTSQTLSVNPAALPTPSFTVSPSAPAVNQTVFFSGLASTAGQGHTIESYRWNFGDGTSGSGSTASHAFTAAGSYVVQLTVTDDVGASVTSAGTTVTVANSAATAPTASFTFSPASPAPGQSVLFNAASSTAGSGHRLVSYAWTFGDFAPAVGADQVSPSHAYSAAGVFTVTLTVTDEIGQTSVTSKTVTISNAAATPPTATFTFSPAAPGVGETVFFNASTSTPGAGHTIASYAWTFGDNGTATGVTTSHPYLTAGTYTVQLKVTDEVGQSATSAATSITAGNPPSPTSNFTFSPAVPGRNDQVVFDASTSTTAQGQSIVDVAWNFGDGTAVVHCPGGVVADCPGPTNRISAHTFAIAQSFIVNLVVTDTAGRTGSKSTTVTIVAANPTVVIGFSPTSPNPGTTVNFSSNGTTYFPGSGAGTFAWTFGDGATSTLANPTHAYAAVGTYTVGLSVTDSKGRTGVGTATVTVVAVTPPASPVAAFTSSPPSPSLAAGGVVSFDGSTSSTPSGAAINLYRWNFGDGTIISGAPAGVAPAPGGTFQAPKHTYVATGSYTVTLTVTDTNNVSGSITGTVTVVP